MIELNVQDMTCGHCVGAVTRAVKSMDPGASVEVDLETKRVRVDGRSSPEALIRVLDDAGYPAALADANSCTTPAKTGCCCS